MNFFLEINAPKTMIVEEFFHPPRLICLIKVGKEGVKLGMVFFFNDKDPFALRNEVFIRRDKAGSFVAVPK